MNLRTDLKPCPFCGSHKVNVWQDMDRRWIAECTEDYCGARISTMESEDDVIARWEFRQFNPLGGYTKPKPR